jgi:hypothetical protein
MKHQGKSNLHSSSEIQAEKWKQINYLLENRKFDLIALLMRCKVFRHPALAPGVDWERIS